MKYRAIVSRTRIKNLVWLRLFVLATIITCAAAVVHAQKKDNTTVAPQPAVAAKPGATTQHIRRITPQIPDANRFDPGKVFLENADKLVYNEHRSTEYRVLKGNVKFRRGNMTLACDSAYFYEASSSLDAFGHVVMVQADTMKVYCNRMHYYGDVEVAKLRHNVRVVNPSMTVTTDSLDYDMLNNVARYFGGGTVVDHDGTRITSVVGRYEQDTRKVQFTSNVNLVNSKIKLHTDVLDYDMNTRLATIEDKTEIVSLEDGNVIYTSSGTYNLATGQGTLYNRSTVKGRDGNTIVGDVMFYDRANDKGHAQGNVVLVDEKNKQTLRGDDVYYDRRTGQSHAQGNVVVTDDKNKQTLRGDEVFYDKRNDQSRAQGNVVITDEKNQQTLQGDEVVYDRRNNRGQAQGNVVLTDIKTNRVLKGDKMDYDRKNGIGHAKGNVVLTDPENKVILVGEVGYHNEKTNESYVTENALAREFSQKDTIYIHADTLRMINSDKKERLLIANKYVRFYRKDLQGVCDSAAVSEKDSILNMYRHAVVWSEGRQIYDMLNNVARYFGGGTVVDHDGTRITSVVGRYEQDTRKVQFTSNVNLVNSKIKLHTDVLDYDMNTRLATIEDKTEIVSLEDGNVIYTSSGTYNLATGQGTLYNRSTVKGRDGNTIVGDVMFYDRANDKGHAQGNVVLVDEKNKQTLRGDDVYYDRRTGQSHAQGNVVVTDDKNKQTLRGDEVFYDKRNDQSRAQGNVVITDEKNQQTLQGDEVVYDRRNNRGQAQGNVVLTDIKTNRVLKGDKMDYDRKNGIGHAKGNVVLTDPENKVILVGEVGYHNEKTNESYVTENALAREFSQKDTIYIHADTLRMINSDKKERLLIANKYVRFYRKDLQGVCDSAAVSEKDSILNMYRHAVIWSEGRQISGEEINVHVQDSTVDWATLPSNGLLIEHLGEEYYNQLSGRTMKAFFANQELRHLDVSGDVEAIFYPMENDSTYNKLVNANSAYLSIDLKPKQTVDKLKMWPDVSGTVVPLFMAKRSQLRIEKFRWFESIRPKDPYDVLVVSDEMRQIFGEAVAKRRTVVR